MVDSATIATMSREIGVSKRDSFSAVIAHELVVAFFRIVR